MALIQLCMSTAIDTLKVYERLKAADLPERAAKEIAAVIKDMIEERLVTKADLKELEVNLRCEMAEIKASIIKWVAGMLVAQAAVITALVKLLQ
ncbi:MAG: DUF1640 domain-containing protein [Nitrospirota bacterium]